jgi:hypothetical protein
MSRFFIELYLDEDVDVLIASMLRARGFGAVTTQEAGMIGSSDEVQLAQAVSLGSTLLTHNRLDFERLGQKYFDDGQSHCGIVIAVRRSPQEIVRRLLIILNSVTADEMKDQLRYI